MPQGLRDLSSMFSAPLGGYNLPLPSSATPTPSWHEAIGYEIAGILGILPCGGAIYGLTWVIRRSRRPRTDDEAGAVGHSTAGAT